MVSNVEFVSDLLLYLNGKEIGEFIREHVSVNLVVKIKIYVKFVH